VEEAAKNFSPNLLCNFLFDLAQKFNLFYEKEKVIGGENERFRIILTSAVGQILKNGLNLLGIETPEKM
jgi:arginyl-tRNA synthetase